jgi:hypothetical protein
MQLENSFEVAAPPEAAWALLNDVPRIVPCMPGTELTEIVDENAWKATMHVKLGPIALQFLVDLRREEADASARRIVLRANAREQKGRGGARATIESSLHEANGGTRVAIVTDLTLQGPVAQYGRGIVGEVAQQLTKQFAACIAKQLEESPAISSAPAEQAVVKPKPVGGLGLAWRALLRRLGLAKR